MRAYGLPRLDDVASPDASDARLYGLKTSRARRGARAGQKSAAKARARRLWKRRARRQGATEARG